MEFWVWIYLVWEFGFGILSRDLAFVFGVLNFGVWDIKFGVLGMAFKFRVCDLEFWSLRIWVFVVWFGIFGVSYLGFGVGSLGFSIFEFKI